MTRLLSVVEAIHQKRMKFGIRLNKEIQKKLQKKIIAFQKWTPEGVLLIFKLYYTKIMLIYFMIGLARQILFNTLTVIVQYHLKLQKKRV